MFEEKLVGQLPVLLKALTMVVPSQFQAVLIFQFVSIGIECVDVKIDCVKIGWTKFNQTCQRNSLKNCELETGLVIPSVDPFFVCILGRLLP